MKQAIAMEKEEIINKLKEVIDLVDKTRKLFHGRMRYYDEFAEYYKQLEKIGYSHPNLNLQKDGIDDWISKTEKRDGLKIKKIEEIEEVSFIYTWNKRATDFIRKLEDESVENTTWMFLFFVAPSKREKGRSLFRKRINSD